MIEELAHYEKSAQGVAKTMADLERRMEKGRERTPEERERVKKHQRKLAWGIIAVVGLAGICTPVVMISKGKYEEQKQQEEYEELLNSPYLPEKFKPPQREEKEVDEAAAVYITGIKESRYTYNGELIDDSGICNKTLEIARKARALSKEARKSIYRAATKKTYCSNYLVAIVAEADDIKDREIYTNALETYHNFEITPAYVSDIIKILEHSKNLPVDDRKTVARLALQKVNTTEGIVEIVRQAQDLNDELIWRTALERLKDSESIKTILGWYNVRNGYEPDAGMEKKKQ